MKEYCWRKEVIHMIETTSWRGMDRVLLKDVVPLATPYAVLVETSASCNIKCAYCIHSKENFGGIMEMDTFNKVLHGLRGFPNKIKRLDMYNMGEPLCNPMLEEMILTAKKENIAEKITFITNGILFNRKRIDSVISSGVDEIRISLQGLDANKYKEVCGVEIDFDKFVANLTYLYEHRRQCKIYMKIADVALPDVDNRADLQRIFGNISDGLYVEHILPIFDEINYSKLGEYIYHQNRRGG